MTFDQGGFGGGTDWARLEQPGGRRVSQTRLPETDPNARTHYLQPGALLASAEPHVVTTIVGSCVAVCLTDATAGVGGMNHFLLPHRVGSESSPRYGTIAVPLLIERVIALGARKHSLEAKVFGGAHVMGALSGRGGHLGEKNVELAFRLLWDAGIPVTAEDVNGERGRKVIFHTHNGSTWVRRL
jgi:chemotaxis protein CheD